MDVKDFKKLFPRYYNGVKEVDQLCIAYKGLGDIFENCVYQFRDNIFLTNNATLSYIREMEILFGIIPDDTLSKEQRVAQIKTKFNDRVPYTLARLYLLLTSILDGQEFEIIEKYNEQLLAIQINAMVQYRVIEIILKQVRSIIPAHIGITINVGKDYDIYFNTEHTNLYTNQATIYNNYYIRVGNDYDIYFNEYTNSFSTQATIYNNYIIEKEEENNGNLEQ